MTKWLQKTALEGNLVRLEVMETLHKNALIQAAADGELWDLWFTTVPDNKTIDSYIGDALKSYEKDEALPFVIIDKKSNKIVGASRYMNATPAHKRLEIGATWYAKSFQKTGVNTECKYLLLTNAFEQLNCIAVEFRTHSHNHPSITAISRLGAKQDGLLRNHQISADGSLRDTVVFSIVKDEWPAVKKSLEFKMAKKYDV